MLGEGDILACFIGRAAFSATRGRTPSRQIAGRSFRA